MTNPIDNAIRDLLNEIGPDWELRSVVKAGDVYTARIARAIEPGGMRTTMQTGDGASPGNAIGMAAAHAMAADLRTRLDDVETVNRHLERVTKG